MKLHWKSLHLAAFSLLLLGAAGCSGINSRQSISPATFLLPGLGQATPETSVDALVAQPLETRAHLAVQSR